MPQKKCCTLSKCDELSPSKLLRVESVRRGKIDVCPFDAVTFEVPGTATRILRGTHRRWKDAARSL